MSAVELGPAIFGLGTMVSGASKALYGDDARVSVEVRADFEHASFGIDFYVVAQVGDLVSGLSLENLAQIATILTASGVGIGRLFRWLKGRRIEKVKREGDRVEISTHDESIHITYNEYKVFVDPGVREGYKALVKPLDRDGIDGLEITAGESPTERIERSERDYFRTPALPSEQLSVDRSTAVLEVVGPVFREDNMWRFAQGGVTFYAMVDDENFLARVAKRDELFGQGHALRVLMETETTRADDELKYNRRIIEVLEHIRPREGEQIDMDMPPKDEGNA